MLHLLAIGLDPPETINMILLDIITKLQAANPNLVVPMGFARPHSYRGDYSQLAFEPQQNVTVAEMLASAKEADGKKYSGYKGGNYLMDGNVTVYLALYGDCGEPISAILLDYMVGNY